MAFTAPAPASVRKARQMTQEKIYDALQGARTADKVPVSFKNGRAATDALIFNPFTGRGRGLDRDPCRHDLCRLSLHRQPSEPPRSRRRSRRQQL